MSIYLLKVGKFGTAGIIVAGVNMINRFSIVTVQES